MHRLASLLLERPGWIAGAAYAGLAAVILASEQMLWADGAFFAYVAGLADPWAMFWQDFPARAGAGLLSTLPPYLAGRLGLGAVAVGQVYQAAWLLLAPAFLALAWHLLPAARKAWFGAVLVFWAAVAMPSFTFPSELWLTAALFWPLFFAALFPERPGHRLTRLLLTPLFVFTHQTMVLLVPVLLAATWRPLIPAPRRERLAFSLLLVLATAAMAAIALTATPGNSLQVAAVAGNAAHFYSPRAILGAPMMGAGIAAAALFLAAQRVDGRTAENLAIVAGLLLAGVTYLVVTQALFPYALYLSRVGIAYGLPLFALALWRWAPAFETRRTWMFLLPLLAAQAVYHGDLNRGWQVYREAVRSELQRPGTPPLLDAGVSAVAEAAYIWPWSMPYLSLTLRLPDAAPRRTAIHDPAIWFVPFQCSQTPQLTYAGALDPAVLPALARHICRMNP